MISRFSGHDSFLCKQFWLKKGYDFTHEDNSFNEEKAVVKLGVGKNMVSAVQYWLKSFNIIDSKNQITDIGKFVFDERKGRDKYIENIATVWLLHYLLVKTNHASIYNIFFNDFRRQRAEFSREHLLAYISKRLTDEGLSFSPNTISNDIAVFIRTYLKPDFQNTKDDIEEDFASVLVDLQFMEQIDGSNYEGKKVDYFKVESGLRYDIPAALILYSILDTKPESKSISFKELYIGRNMPGSVFAMNKEGLYNKLKQLEDDYGKATIQFSETAGVQELQIKKQLNKMEVLHECY
jgi:hypothetical protein